MNYSQRSIHTVTLAPEWTLYGVTTLRGTPTHRNPLGKLTYRFDPQYIQCQRLVCVYLGQVPVRCWVVIHTNGHVFIGIMQMDLRPWVGPDVNAIFAKRPYANPRHRFNIEPFHIDPRYTRYPHQITTPKGFMLMLDHVETRVQSSGVYSPAILEQWLLPMLFLVMNSMTAETLQHLSSINEWVAQQCGIPLSSVAPFPYMVDPLVNQPVTTSISSSYIELPLSPPREAVIESPLLDNWFLET